MRILFVVPYVPNLIRVRPFNFIRTLARQGHDLTVATLWTSDEERADLEALQGLGVNVIAHPLPLWRSLVNSLRSLPGRAPLQASYCWQPALARALDGAVRGGGFHVVHVEHLRGARYGLALRNGHRSGSGTGVPVVWDSVDCISHLFAQAARRSRSLKGRLITRLELNRTRRYEAQAVRRFDQVLVTSPADKTALVTLAAQWSRSNSGEDRPNVHVVPNGVDLDYFQPGDGPRDAETIVFTGKMSYHANITAALYLLRDIMPLVWAARSTVRVCIVGKDPPGEIRSEAANDERVLVTGTVPDIRPYLRQATLAVAPVPYGAGIQNKVLEAMACATPVVTSSQAASALSITPQQEVYIADDPGAFASAILALLASPAERARLGAAGRNYVDEQHSWDAIVRRLTDIYSAAASRT